MPERLDAPALAAWLADAARPAPLLLDVREEWEFEHGHLPGARHVPMTWVPAHLAELQGQTAIVCICHHGIRSMQVARYLVAQGLTGIYNLHGGVEAWSVEVDPSLPRY